MTTNVNKTPVTCQYCDKICSNKYTLATHQTSTKYCLAKQREANNTKIVEELYECHYCGLKMSFRIQDRHMNTCKRTLHAQLADKETTLAELQVQAEMYKKMYENTQAPKQDGCTQTDACVQESMGCIEELEETLRKYKKFYTKYKKLYTKSLEKKGCHEIDTQTDIDNHTMSDTIAILTKQICALQAELETFRNTSNMSKQHEVAVIDPDTKMTRDSVLNIDGVIIEARASDGYINATQMCQSVLIPGTENAKQFSNWNKNESSKAFLRELAADLTIVRSALIIKGTTVFKQGGVNVVTPTWVHPRVAVHLAQWLSPKYAARVTGWIFELHVRGTVTLGQEHTNAENLAVWQEQIARLTMANTEITERLQELTTIHTNLVASHKLLTKNHQAILKKRVYHQFKQGSCMYVCYRLEDSNIKVGISNNVNQCLYAYRRLMPQIKIHFLVYFEPTALVESLFKIKHASELLEPNHEVYIMTPEAAIGSIMETLFTNKIEHTIENDIALYND